MSSKRYFKVVYGFSEDEYLTVDETEVKKAIYAHLTGKKTAFNSGSVSGDKIIVIKEDWHKELGYNRGYKLKPEDYAEIEATVAKKYVGLIARAQEEVKQALRENRLVDITKPLEIAPASRTFTQGPTSLGELLANNPDSNGPTIEEKDNEEPTEN